MLFKFCLSNYHIMKITYPYFICTFIISLFLSDIGKAQTSNLKVAPAHVTIDGSLAEWGDSLAYYNPETAINYTIANDKDNIYLVLKTNDPMQQHSILQWGITLSIDPKGRKKSTYSVTFPVQDEHADAFVASETLQQKKRDANMTKLKRIKADGFKDVENDVFTLQNTYGFRVAIDYDARGFLVYEEVIPLSLFHADDAKKNEWAFDIKLNAPQITANKESNDQDSHESSGGRGGGGRRGGGMGGGGRGGAGGGRGGYGGINSSQPRPTGAVKEVDFWSKYSLANTQ
jgi:uncharacterized membrane protein YgcG